MAITWTINNQTGSYKPGEGAVEQGQWDLYYDKGARNDFNVTGATTVNVKTFQQDNYEVGDTYDYVVDSQFWGSEVYYWDDGVWTTYINAAGDLVDGHALTFKNVAWDNKAPVYLYIRKTPNGGTPEDAEYAAYQVFVDSLNPVFEDDEITINPELHRDDEHKVKPYWFNKADVVEAGGEGATGATLTITFDDTEDLKYLSSGIAYLQYSTGKDLDLENPGTNIFWTPFDAEHVIAVDPENITYDEEKKVWTLTAFLPDSVDKDGDNLADGNYYQFKLVDGVGNISDGEKIFRAPVDDTAAELVYQPTMIWQDATAPVIEEANMALHGTHVDNDVAQPINGHAYDPEDEDFRVITDRNKTGTPYQFTVSGTAPLQAEDKGTALSVVVSYTGLYQELVLVDVKDPVTGKVIGSKYVLADAEPLNGTVNTNYNRVSLAEWTTSDPISLYPTVPGTEAIGYYKVEAKVVDKAGNETAYDPFYVYFDNTLPASPDVVLNDKSAVYDADAKTSYVKVFGEDTSVTVAPGSYGELDERLHAIGLRTEDPDDPEAPIYYEYAVSTGALDIPALVGARAHFDPENWKGTPGSINLDNFTKFWGDDAKDGQGVIKDDAYSVIFFTQNEYGIESSTFVNKVSVVHFVVDSTDPNAVGYTPSVAKKYPAAPAADDIVWYDDAELTVKFNAQDLWTSGDPDDYEHVSGVASFTINDEVITDITFNEGEKWWELKNGYIVNKSGDLGGIWNFEVSATDKAGNAGETVTKKIGIDTAAPEIEGTSIKWGEEGHVDFEKGVTTLYVGKDVYDEIETEGTFQLVFNAVDYNGATLEGMDKTGSGIDLNDDPLKSYYTYNGGAATAFTDGAGKATPVVALDEDVYSYQVYYIDNVGNHYDAPVDYTVCIDATAPVALGFDLEGPGEIYDDDDKIHWFSATGADVSLTFKADDQWNEAHDADSLAHVSGVDFFTVGSTKYNVDGTAGTDDHKYFYSTIANIRTGDAGIVEYDFTATDKAGNVSVKYSEQGGPVYTIGIDDAAPVINHVYVVWGAGEDQKTEIDAETKTITFNAEDIAAFGGAENFWLYIKVEDVSGATTGVTKGVGLAVTKETGTYWKSKLNDGGFSENTNFIDVSCNTTGDKAILDSGTYVFALEYTDMFAHAADIENYTVKFDGGPTLTAGGTYAVDGPADGVTPKGPTVSVIPATFAGLDKDYASAFNLTFTIGSLSGIQSWTMTKETAEGAVTIYSYDAEEGFVPPVFGLNTADDEQVALWQLEEGENKYTVTIQDKADNEPKVQEITLKYDTQVTGTIEVEDQTHKKITKNADGKYYVTTNNYNLIYGVVDTEENPELSGAHLVYYKEAGDVDYNEPHLILGWDQAVYNKADGVETTHQAIVTDNAGNTDDGIEATVVVDQTKPVISVAALPLVATTVKTGVTGKKTLTTADVTDGDHIPAGPIDEKDGLTVNWTTLIDPNNFNIDVTDANIAKVLLNGEELDHNSIKFALSTYGGDDADAVIEEGTTTWTITGIDKVDHKTTVTVTISYDETAPEITGIKFGSYEAQDTDGGENQAEALDHKVYVADAKDFTFTMTVTDNVDENVKVYYTFVDKDDDFEIEGDWSDWTVVVDGSMKIESPDEGFYHFAAVDQAGNVIQSKYYYVAEATQPTQPTVWYKDEKGAIYTDVDSKGWFNKPMQVFAEFENTASYDQTNYIAVNFDLEAYQETYLSTGSYAEALRAAIHLGEEDQDEYLLTSEVTTVAPGDGHTWTWTTDGFVGEKHEYWMFSIDAGDNVTKDQFKYQLVKVDTIAPTLTLDLQGYAGEWAGDVFTGVWTNESVFINAEAEDKDSGLFSLTPGSSWAQTVSSATSEGTTQVFTATDYAGNVTTKTVIVKVDKIDPEMDVDLGGYTPGTWSADPVTITVTASDALSGLAEDPSGVYVIEETTTVTLVAKDNAGNFVEQVIEVLIDNSDLVINLDSHGYEFGTWTNEAVTVDVTATSTSPITYITPSPVNFEEEGNVNFDFTATNAAGKTVTETKNIKIDWTDPEMDVDLGGYTPGTWSADPVTITVTASDALSGLAEDPSGVYVIEESTTVKLVAKDNAGNVVEQEIEVLIDNGKPVISLDSHGYTFGEWTTEKVTVDVNATSTSPITDMTPSPVKFEEEGDITYDFFATNVAGTTTETKQIKIDWTAPVASVDLNGYEEGSWTNEDVEITASATDALSGIATSTYVNQTISEEGETPVVMEATDVAGNATSDTVLIKIDKTAPVASVDLNGYEAGTWTKEDVQITASATDALSGIAESTYVDQTISAEGVQTVVMEATDVAGNVTTDAVVVKIDKSGPVIERTDDYADGTWSKTAVTITATATDNLSGILSGELIVPQVSFEQEVTAEGKTTVEWTVADMVGNSSTMTAEVWVDTVAPELILDAGAYEFGSWTNEAVTVTVDATDATSGVKAHTESPLAFEEEGVYQQMFFAEDNAGNVTSTVKSIKIDMTAPVIERTDEYQDGTWSSVPVTITATAYDALSGLVTPATYEITLEESTVVELVAEDAAGNKTVQTVNVLIDTGAPVLTLDAGDYVFGEWTNKDVTVNVAAASLSPIVSMTASPVVITAEGTTNQEFFATNAAGVTTTEYRWIRIDKTLPVVVSASYAPAEDLTPFVVVTASFSDAGGSGLKNGEYSFDGNTWEVYDGSFNVYQNTPIYFRATDNAGNVSGITELNVSNIAIDYAEVEGEGTVKGALLETEYGVSGKYLVDALDLGNITGKLTVKNGGKSVFTANIEYGVITKTSNKDGSKTFMLDNSKSTVIDLTVNEKKTAGSTEWDIQFVTDDSRFIEGDNGDDDWTTIEEGSEYDLGILNYDGEVFENWVGFGDEIDYRVFTLESSAKLQFALESEDTAKMTVYQLNTKTGKLKSLGNVTISAKEIGTTKWTKDLLVEEGTYYISVQSTNKKAASGTGAGEYEVSVAGEFYPVISDDAKINNTWKTATDLGGDYAEGWVGFGNASDFYKFSVDENGKIAFDMEEDTYKAVLAKELKITCLTDTGKSVALEQLDKDTLVSKKEMAAGEYIIGVTCSNVKKYNTSYGVGIAVL